MDEVILLLENYWILRETDPESYFRIKDKESELRTFFREKLGYTLIVNPHLVRITKIPGEAKAWMENTGFATYQELLLPDLIDDIRSILKY